MKRIYQSVVEVHLSEDDQMAFLPGPRQVGKTTIAKQINYTVSQGRIHPVSSLAELLTGYYYKRFCGSGV